MLKESSHLILPDSTRSMRKHRIQLSINQDYNDAHFVRNIISKQTIRKRPQLDANLHVTRLVNSNARTLSLARTTKICHI